MSFFIVFLLTHSLVNTLWIMLLLGIIFFTFVYLRDLRKRKILKNSGIHDIDTMDGIQFEHYLKELYKAQGYKGDVTTARGDFGADLILKKEGKKIVIQAKRYKNNVGVKAIQEVKASQSHYKAEEAWVVTNSHFTKQAIELARSNSVTLIDREQLIKMITHINQTDLPDPKMVKRTIEPKKVVCDKCQNEMIIRNGPKGPFYGCKSYPKCTNTKEVS